MPKQSHPQSRTHLPCAWERNLPSMASEVVFETGACSCQNRPSRFCMCLYLKYRRCQLEIPLQSTGPCGSGTRQNPHEDRTRMSTNICLCV